MLFQEQEAGLSQEEPEEERHKLPDSEEAAEGTDVPHIEVDHIFEATVPVKKPKLVKNFQALDGTSLPQLFTSPDRAEEVPAPRVTRTGRATKHPEWMKDYTA